MPYSQGEFEKEGRMNERDLERLLRSRRVTRRGFLYVAGIGSAAAFLAACAGQPIAPTSAPPTSAPAAPTSASTNAPAPTTAAAGKLEDELFLYNWAEYVNPDNIDAFSKANNVKVTLSFYESNEDALAKVEAGGTGYDVL